MNYFEAAFGDFAPHRDEDAAIKFVLNVIMLDNRLDELAELIVAGNSLGAIEGEPGWTLERRDEQDEGKACYGRWPSGARFRAYVDPQGYELAHPEFFMARDVIARYLSQAMDAYAAADVAGEHASALGRVRAALS